MICPECDGACCVELSRSCDFRCDWCGGCYVTAECEICEGGGKVEESK